MRQLAGLLLVMALGPAAIAAPVAITNPGFESNVITAGAFVVLNPTGWSNYDPSSIIDNAFNAVGVIRPLPGVEYFPGGTPEGVNAALVFLAGNQTAEAGLQQTLSATLQANTTYTLTAQIGNIDSGTSLPGSSGGAGVFFNLEGFPGYRLDLMAGGVVIASDNNSIAGTLDDGEFGLATLMFSTGASHPQLGQSLGIRLVNLKAAGTVEEPNIEVDFDDVQLDASPVPEPASIALLGVAAAVVLRRRRRA